jgi:hypothetical protein
MRCVVLADRGQEHLRRGDHLPAGGVVLAHPELVVAQGVQVRGELDVVAHLQHRVLADRVMRGEERAEFHAGHGVSGQGREGRPNLAG